MFARIKEAEKNANFCIQKSSIEAGPLSSYNFNWINGKLSLGKIVAEDT